jgi:hypothetical protein
MSSIETMNTHLTAAAGGFDVYPLRLRFRAREAIHFPAGQTANLLRGGLGKVLFRSDRPSYSAYFAPTSPSPARPSEASGPSPSGLRDLPRPFVFRVAHLEGARFAAGELFEIGINIFLAGEPPIQIFRDALCSILPARLDRVEGGDGGDGGNALRLALDPGPPASRVRVSFLTPTEIKGADRPDFGPLFARIRDRVSTLRALYGSGPLEIDFAAMGERARRIEMTRCEIEHVEAERTSRATGQRHPLGGFAGIAEYQGELAEFTPYLEAARYTGAGRQTVWGKGQIAWETL